MSVHYLNGHRFRRAIIAGSLTLIRNREHLNKINVFPVADGDTGSNMAATMRAILQRAYDSHEVSISKMATLIADSALMSARGNSGAILAQFFQGLSEGFKGKITANTKDFGIAVEKGVSMALEALSNPREGTILSVMKAWAEAVKKEAELEKDFNKLIQKAQSKLQAALDNTPNQLEVLKKANVVDSGALGFVNIIEGVVGFLSHGSVREEVIDELEHDNVDIEEETHIEYDPDSIHFRFCTEFLLQGENINKSAIRKHLETMGDSLIVAGSTSKVKVHVHSNSPEQVFDLAARFGTLVQKKAEDMKAQHETAHGDKKSNFPYGLVVDSSCEVSDANIKKYDIKVVPLLLILNEKEYLDKESMTSAEFYNRLQEDKGMTPKTSLPTPIKTKNALLEALKTHDEVIYLGLSSKVSGTFQSFVTIAKQIEEQNPGKKIHCIDSYSISYGSGFMMEEIIKQIEAGKSVADIQAGIESMVQNFQIVVYLDTVDYLIKGGRLSKVKGFIANLLGLNPILTFTLDGKVEKLGVAKGEAKAIKFFINWIIPERKVKRLGILHAANIQAAINLESELQKRFPRMDIPTIELSPVLGTHAGPGAVGLAVQYE